MQMIHTTRALHKAPEGNAEATCDSSGEKSEKLFDVVPICRGIPLLTQVPVWYLMIQSFGCTFDKGALKRAIG